MPYKIKERCNNCEKCIEVCQMGAIVVGGVKPQIKSDLCTDCGSCADICPERAIEGLEYY